MSRRTGPADGLASTRRSRLAEANTRSVAVCELDTCGLQSTLQGFNRSFFQFIPSLKSSNRIG
jgi:hypothetical protein